MEGKPLAEVGLEGFLEARFRTRGIQFRQSGPSMRRKAADGRRPGSAIVCHRQNQPPVAVGYGLGLPLSDTYEAACRERKEGGCVRQNPTSSSEYIQRGHEEDALQR